MDNYVAWCHYVGGGNTPRIETCDSDSLGAFKVYRECEIVRIKSAVERILSLAVTTPIDHLRQDIIDMCQRSLSQ